MLGLAVLGRDKRTFSFGDNFNLISIWIGENNTSSPSWRNWGNTCLWRLWKLRVFRWCSPGECLGGADAGCWGGGRGRTRVVSSRACASGEYVGCRIWKCGCWFSYWIRRLGGRTRGRRWDTGGIRRGDGCRYSRYDYRGGSRWWKTSCAFIVDRCT